MTRTDRRWEQSIAQTVTTRTSTSTTFTSTTTVYAACSTANFLNRINGDPAFEFQGVPDSRLFNIVTTPVANSLECCNLAFSPRSPTDALRAPQGFLFDRRPDPVNPETIVGVCTIVGDTEGVCPAVQPIIGIVRNEAQSDPNEDFPVSPAVSNPTLGNAACGKIVGPQ